VAFTGGGESDPLLDVLSDAGVANAFSDTGRFRVSLSFSIEPPDSDRLMLAKVGMLADNDWGGRSNAFDAKLCRELAKVSVASSPWLECPAGMKSFFERSECGKSSSSHELTGLRGVGSSTDLVEVVDIKLFRALRGDMARNGETTDLAIEPCLFISSPWSCPVVAQDESAHAVGRILRMLCFRGVEYRGLMPQAPPFTAFRFSCEAWTFMAQCCGEKCVCRCLS
jgi:hypothetical protein